MDENIQIIDTRSDNIHDYGVCGYKSMNRPGYPEKVAWLNDRFKEGLKLKTLYSEQDGTQGMIEYMPGEICWRPVDADGYMFIHCLFAGFKKAYKGKGYATRLLNECIGDAKKEKRHGVAVVTRKGSFMVDKKIFLKNGFEVTDQAPSDFELLALKFDEKSPSPKFRGKWEKKQSQFGKGLTIIRADQCPYTVKNVNEIYESAKNDFHLQPEIITFKNHKEAQNSPCAFGTFGMIYDGRLIAEHPISGTRFKNMMNKSLK
jgi:GNAT superfamily N-acetyltransferase